MSVGRPSTPTVNPSVLVPSYLASRASLENSGLFSPAGLSWSAALKFQFIGLRVILRHSPPHLVEQAKIRFGQRMAVRRRFGIPLDRFGVILQHAPTVFVEPSKVLFYAWGLFLSAALR